MSEATHSLSDVLMALGTETDVTVDDVRAAILEHPEFASEIQAFAIEWYTTPDAGMPPVDDPVPVAVPLARDAATTEANPFAGKTPTELRALAAECEIPLSILEIQQQPHRRRHGAAAPRQAHGRDPFDQSRRDPGSFGSSTWSAP